MDKNDEKDDQMNEDPKFENYSSDDDVPLWLQGLDNDELDQHEPITSKEDVEDSWVPEISEEISDDDQVSDEDKDIDTPLETPDSSDYGQTIDENESFESGPTEEIEIDKLPNGGYSDDIGPTLNDPPSSEGFMEISDMETSEFSKQEEPILEEESLIEGDLPEWLQEMIADQEKPKTSDVDDEMLEISDLGEDQTHDQESNSYDQASVEDELNGEDHLGIGDDLDDEEEFHPAEDILTAQEKDLDDDWLAGEELESDERFSNEEDLYMTEPSSYMDIGSAVEMADEETKPVKVSHVDEDDIPSAIEEPFVEEPQADDQEDPSLTLEDPFDDEALAIEDEEDLSPALEEPFDEEPQEEDEEDLALTLEDPFVDEAFAIEDEEEILPTMEPHSVEETHMIEDEEELEGLKHHLAQGNFDEAFPTINKLIDDSSHLDKLELWLKEATESNAETNSEAWEALGDITLKQNKPDEAFNAYAKAIKHLLVSDEVSDETR